MEFWRIREDRAIDPKYIDFIHPETGYYFGGRINEKGEKTPYSDVADLLSHIHAYCDENDLKQLSDVEYLVHNYLCSKSHIRSICRKLPQLERNLGQRIMGGLNLIWRLQNSASWYVDSLTAERRARMCVQCPRNKMFSKNSLERFEERMMKKATGDRTTKQDHMLHNCSVCSCNLRSAVHWGIDLLKERTSSKQLEAFPKNALNKKNERFTCWRREEIEKII